MSGVFKARNYHGGMHQSFVVNYLHSCLLGQSTNWLCGPPGGAPHPMSPSMPILFFALVMLLTSLSA